jgi:hypothetical protein
MRLVALLALRAMWVAVDFTVEDSEDTPGLCVSKWKLVKYVNIPKLETTYNMLLRRFCRSDEINCKGLPPEAISTCQSDLSLTNQSVSRVHRTRRKIYEITKDKEEAVFNSDNTYAYTHIEKNKGDIFNFMA